MAKRGRPPKITDAHRVVLVSIVQAAPMAMMEELCAALRKRIGVWRQSKGIQVA